MDKRFLLLFPGGARDRRDRLLEALRIPFALVPVVAAILASNGCTSMACLQWSAEKGACPSKDEAFNRFGGQSCVADILSVDSDAEADDDACCYEVTKRGKGELGCGATSGADGPTSGQSGGTTSTGSTACGGCAAFRDGSAPDLCPGSVDIYNDLVACLCSGACAEACDDGSCSTSFDTKECQLCVDDTQTGCGNEMNACNNDL